MARASKRESVPAKGDFYPTVRAWCQRLGVTALDQRANEVKLDHAACRLYIAAVMGPRFPVRFRVLHSSVGRGGDRYIVLDSQTRHTLGTVLHECAHAVQLTKAKDRRDVRRDIRAARRAAGSWKPLPELPRRRDLHGEAFCRTYARLLRETLV
jgi:hypothetical protein